MYSLSLFVLLLVIIICCVAYHYSCTESYTPNHQYNGLVLFDIDGTLTTGKENSKVVQYFLDKNWAVGICTAGSMYTISNLNTFSWMPKNLYEFIIKTEGITFNNVMSKILCGENDKKSYNGVYELSQQNDVNPYLQIGYLKGFALEMTAKKLNITNTNNIILFDDLNNYIAGVNEYNNDFTVICAGDDCKGELTIDNIVRYGY